LYLYRSFLRFSLNYANIKTFLLYQERVYKNKSDFCMLKKSPVYTGRFPQEFQEMNDADVFHTYLKSPKW